MAVTSIRNETPSRLTLTGTDGRTLTLAPLQEVEIGEGSGFHFGELERERVITTHREASSKLRENIGTTIFAGGFWLVVFANILASVDPRFGTPECRVLRPYSKPCDRLTPKIGAPGEIERQLRCLALCASVGRLRRPRCELPTAWFVAAMAILSS